MTNFKKPAELKLKQLIIRVVMFDVKGEGKIWGFMGYKTSLGYYSPGIRHQHPGYITANDSNNIYPKIIIHDNIGKMIS